MIALLIAIMVALSLSTDTFLTTSNLVNVLDQVSALGSASHRRHRLHPRRSIRPARPVPVSPSRPSSVCRSARISSVPLGFLAAIVAGAFLGLLTGNIVVRSGVNSFIATLATSIVYRGLAVVVTAGAIAYPLADQAEDWGMLTWPSLFGLTSATWVFIVVVAIIGIMVAATTFGRRIYAVGGNAEAARLSGVRVGQVQIAVFVVSGICSALAGLILSSRAGSAQSSMATGMELSAIAAAVIGGTSILGGEGAVWRGVVGAVLLTLIGNGFNLLGWDTTYQQVVQGLLILLAVTVDQFLRRRAT